MVIEKLHGLHATSMTLNDRFSMLHEAASELPKLKRRKSTESLNKQNTNFKNRNLIEQIAQRLEQQARRRTLRQRMGLPQGALRRFGSESSLPGLRRVNSFGNLSQGGLKKFNQRQFTLNGNLRRSASFSNLSGGPWRNRLHRLPRGARRRGALRARFRRGGQQMRGVGAVRLRGRGGDGRGRAGGVRGVGGMRRAGRGRGAGRGGAARGRGRGGITRSDVKPVPTKEELDLQLDEYMASSKSTLDKELDEYMKHAAMELE